MDLDKEAVARATARWLLPLLLCAAAPLACASTLTTRSFVAQVEVHCAEGNVSCDKVTYVGTSRKTGKRIKLNGKTLNGLCADGVSPCRFLGYEFRNGSTRYRLLEEGRLVVTQGGKLLLEESGTWKW